MKILLLEAGRCGIITNSNVQSVRFGRLAQRERRCLTSTRPGVQIPHRPPSIPRPPAMEVFFVSREDSLDLNPARGLRYARKAIRGMRYSSHGLAWIMPLLCCKPMRLSRARQLGSTPFPTSLFRIKPSRVFVRPSPKVILSEKRRENAEIYDRGQFGSSKERRSVNQIYFRKLMTWGFANRYKIQGR